MTAAEWYRYHHLFADVLQARCSTSIPARCRSCTGGRRVVRAERRAVPGHRPRAGRRGFRARGGPRRAGDPSPAPDQAGGLVRRWLEELPTSGPGQAGAQRHLCRGIADDRRYRRGRGAAARRRAMAGPAAALHRDREPARPRWSSPTRRNTAASRRRSRCTGRAGPGQGRAAGRCARPAGAGAARGEPTCLGGGIPGARVLGERGPGGRAAGLFRVRGRSAAGRVHR